MTGVKQTFDQTSQDRLINIMAASGYPERYLQLCKNFGADRALDGSPLDLRRTTDIFQEVGVQVHFDKQFKVFTFDPQEAAGWRWQGKLVIQKYGRFEPMFEGDTLQHAIGSTMLGLAIDAGDRRASAIPRDRFLPPHPNRPRFDGDMRTMERLIPELVALTRWMRELVAKNWTSRHGATDDSGKVVPMRHISNAAQT